MGAGVVANILTSPDTSRSFTVTVGGVDLTGDVYLPSLVFEDQGTSTQATTSFELRGVTLAERWSVDGQALVEIEDHVSGGLCARGFVDSHDPDRRPGGENVITITASDHTSLLDNIIPFEARPAGESDAARIGYLWGLYAGGLLSGHLANVATIESSMPAQQFAGVSLRQALDMIAAQASTSAVWRLDVDGRLHYFTSESNDAPSNVTSDTPGVGEIAASNSLRVDFDAKNFTSAVYVRGKTDAGSGWVYSEAAKLNAPVQRTRFLDAPDCTTEAMRNSLGNMYLGRLNASKVRGEFTVYSPNDGWRAGQNVTVRSSHHGINTSYRIARVRTTVLGPAANRRYDVEFGSARAGSYSADDPLIVMGRGISGDLVDDNGALLLSSSPNAWTGGLGPALRRYITSRTYNGDFALTPPSADSTIVNSWNPLPFWSFTLVSGTSVTGTSILDTSSASGRVIRLSMMAGAAGDDSYFEQIIPISGSGSQSYAYVAGVTFRSGASPTVAKGYVNAAFLQSDGATQTGSDATTSFTTTSMGASTVVDYSAAPNFYRTPTDAYFLRVRFGLQRDAAATSAVDDLDVMEVRLHEGGTQHLVPDDQDPASYGPTNIFQSNGQTTIQTNYGSGSGVTPRILLQADSTNPAISFDGVADQLLMRFGGTSFPSTPGTNDHFYRNDLQEWCHYDGTRWLGPAHTLQAVFTSGTFPLSATGYIGSAPIPGGTSYDVYLLNWVISFYVAGGGSALSASHKWDIKIVRAPSSTTITTYSINSGASSTTRTSGIQSIAALTGTSDVELGFTATKTGTPGNLYAYALVTYRLVRT